MSRSCQKIPERPNRKICSIEGVSQKDPLSTKRSRWQSIRSQPPKCWGWMHGLCDGQNHSLLLHTFCTRENLTRKCQLNTNKNKEQQTWTISFFLWTSPFGNGTYSSASRSNSVANASLRPTLFTAPLLASMYITSPTRTCTSLQLV